MKEVIIKLEKELDKYFSKEYIMKMQNLYRMITKKDNLSFTINLVELKRFFIMKKLFSFLPNEHFSSEVKELHLIASHQDCKDEYNQLYKQFLNKKPHMFSIFDDELYQNHMSVNDKEFYKLFYILVFPISHQTVSVMGELFDLKNKNQIRFLDEIANKSMEGFFDKFPIKNEEVKYKIFNLMQQEAKRINSMEVENIKTSYIRQAIEKAQLELRKKLENNNTDRKPNSSSNDYDYAKNTVNTLTTMNIINY